METNMINSGEYIPNKNKETVINLLQSNGYKVTDCGNYIQFPCLWRSGDDPTSGVGYINDDLYIDFVTGEKFDSKELFKKVLGLKNEEELCEIYSKNIVNIPQQEQIKQKKTFDKDLLLNLQSDYSYPKSRGILEETCKLFKTGMVGKIKGKQSERYVIPIFDSKDNIVGFTGRTLINDKIKYKHSGKTTDWVWPAYLNSKLIIQTKCCILVESPFCVLKLWQCGIKNVLCLFGTELHLGILNFLLKCNVDKIIVATNNELNSPNGGVGNEAAIKIKKKISKYWDSRCCIIKLPFEKDFADMSDENINKWKEELKILVGESYLKYD